MAKKRATSKTTKPSPATPPSESVPAPRTGGPVLRTDTRLRFTLYNLLGKERAWYDVTRVDLPRPTEPVSEKAVAHSIIIIDRSGSMTPFIEELKETLIKLLTLEEYRNFDLLVTLLSYSGEGDLQVHFQRTPITEIMQRDSKQVQEIKAIHTAGLTCISQALQLAGSLVKDTELTAITLHSDGYANDPSPNTESRTIEQLIGDWQERSLFINTIAYSDYSDFRFLSKIANGASGVCVRAGSLREVYDSLSSTTKLLGGQVTPPIEEPLSPEYDYQVFVSHTSGKINGAAGPLHIRGLKPEDDAFVYKYRRLNKSEYEKLADVPEVQTGEAVVAFARAHLAEGNLNTAKYALASTFDKTLIDKHGRALTNLEVAALMQDLDLLLFQPGLLAEHEILRSVPVNRKIALLSLMEILDEHKEGFLVNFEHLRQNYIRRGERRIPGERDEQGKVIEPWLKTELVDPADLVRISAIEINRNTANLNICIARRVRLVQVADGKPIEQAAGIKLDNLMTFNNYTVVSDGELNIRTLRIKISEQALSDRLAGEGVLEVDGAPAAAYDPNTEYTLRLDTLPLVPPFEGTINLDGMFEQLAELKVLSSICAAHLKEASAVWRMDQVAELKRHYLSMNLYVNLPTTKEYADRNQALAEGTLDTRTSYKIDIGSRSIINLGKLHSANKFLDRMYEVLDINGQKIDKPTFEDCLEDVTFRHKQLSARTKVMRSDEFMRRLFDDFLGLRPNGSAVAVLKRVGAHDLAEIVQERARGRQPSRTALVSALTTARKAVDHAADTLFNEKVSPLVFYIGSTGTLPDEIETKALTAEELTRKYPDLTLSKDEQDGLFFEVGQAILSVYAKREYFSRDKPTGGANTARRGVEAIWGGCICRLRVITEVPSPFPNKPDFPLSLPPWPAPAQRQHRVAPAARLSFFGKPGEEKPEKFVLLRVVTTCPDVGERCDSPLPSDQQRKGMLLWPDTFDQWAAQLLEEGSVHAAVYGLARSYGAQTDRANDLADDAEQHGLSQSAGHSGEAGFFSSYDHFRNWVRRCAVNYVHDQFARIRQTQSLQEGDDVAAPQQEMDDETAQQTRACWDNLSERDRSLLERHFLDGLTYQEMAQTLLPPDGRTPQARGQDIRKQTLAAKARYEQCLLAHGIDPQQWGCRE